MSDGTQNAIHKATQAVLRGLVRVLLRHGIDYSAFSTLARQVFTDTAYEKLERENGKATASAVSALTGLSRKEIKRLRETESNVLAAAAQGRNRAVRVLAGWTTDPLFMSDGRPRVLSLDATSGGFQSLVESHSGDVTPIAMLALLEQAGCVARVEGGVQLMRNAFLPMSTPAERFNILGTDASELVASIDHNIHCAESERVFQRKVSVQGLSAKDLEDFKQYSNERSQALLEEYDKWLSERVLASEKLEDENVHYTAVGIYFYSDVQGGVGDERNEI